MAESRIGGSFAPQITDDDLARYRHLAEDGSPPVREVMLSLCDMVEVFHETGPSQLEGRPHPVGIGKIVPLESAEVARIDPHVPTMSQLESYARLIGALPTGTETVAGVMEIAPDGVTRKFTVADAIGGNLVRFSGQGKEIEGKPGHRYGLIQMNKVVDQAAYDLRNAAHHLLWYALELNAGREPGTTDRIFGG